MERGIEMVLHSVIIGLILYMLMVFVLKQKEEVAENRSILIASFILTAVFIIMTMNLFNEESKYCMLPQSFKDNVFTDEEYHFSKRIITEYEKQHKIQNGFCNKKNIHTN